MVNLLNSPYGISKTIYVYVLFQLYDTQIYTISFMFHKFFKIKVGSVN